MVSKELPRLLLQLQFVFYRDSTTEPNPKACSETTLEFLTLLLPPPTTTTLSSLTQVLHKVRLGIPNVCMSNHHKLDGTTPSMQFSFRCCEILARKNGSCGFLGHQHV
ncbi:hypothetical protein TanjilG_16067 [Lupinus angustifolius]|uniref:Uncharacterized protein n=1 Tax=Lupinus angustifolius TaxID=3871 RepID=A0A4P1RH20_LUPAN|nr:hypothetical protein TanjilG_16067 [Lupinus angustifolius]